MNIDWNYERKSQILLLTNNKKDNRIIQLLFYKYIKSIINDFLSIKGDVLFLLKDYPDLKNQLENPLFSNDNIRKIILEDFIERYFKMLKSINTGKYDKKLQNYIINDMEDTNVNKDCINDGINKSLYQVFNLVFSYYITTIYYNNGGIKGETGGKEKIYNMTLCLKGFIEGYKEDYWDYVNNKYLKWHNDFYGTSFKNKNDLIDNLKDKNLLENDSFHYSILIYSLISIGNELKNIMFKKIIPLLPLKENGYSDDTNKNINCSITEINGLEKKLISKKITDKAKKKIIKRLNILKNSYERDKKVVNQIYVYSINIDIYENEFITEEQIKIFNDSLNEFYLEKNKSIGILISNQLFHSISYSKDFNGTINGQLVISQNEKVGIHFLTNKKNLLVILRALDNLKDKSIKNEFIKKLKEVKLDFLLIGYI